MLITPSTRLIPLLALAVAFPAAAADQAPGEGKRKPRDPAAIERLLAETSGEAQVSIHEATGAARFVRIPPGKRLGLLRQLGPSATLEDVKGRSTAFLRSHGRVFGIADADAELRLVSSVTDRTGATHLRYEQVYRGVPVFAGVLKTHFDRAGQLTAANGIFVPDIALDPSPSRTPTEAARVALATVQVEVEGARDVSVRATRLYVFREGLARGVPGENRLVWEVEAGNGLDVREFVYVDAHSGKLVDRITGIHDARFRQAYQGFPNFPATPFWTEGDAFPTASGEANNVIAGSGEAYDLFSHVFDQDSWDGAGGTMHGIFDATAPGLCPNAFWNGLFTAFCAGVSPDDVVAHEWGHAYTERTHGLIYQWQPGALNESYSDIWGEVVDLINARGSDSPGGPRTAGTCTTFTPPRGELVVNSPAAIAGTYPAQRAAFGPPLTTTGVTGEVVVALDPANAAGPSTTDACSPLTNPGEVAGKIALVDRGTCTFVTKVLNCQAAGAIAVIVANNQPTGLAPMGGASAAVTISSLGTTRDDGNRIKGQLPAPGVNATLRSSGGVADNTYRWLVSEDSSAFGGAIRDMWDPTCYGSPGKVPDVAFYACGTGDGGGVHTNSGVPNHAFALIVDGGTYNGQTVMGIGLTKAAHIYFRAQAVYQHRASDFADHADALEQSCADLVGDELTDLATGAPSGQVLTAADCDQVAAAAAAVELRTPPTQCAFLPLLAKNPPDRCGPDATQVNVFFDDFEGHGDDDDDDGQHREDGDDDDNAPLGGWTVSHTAASADFTPRDWVLTSSLPDGRPGSGFFAVDPDSSCFGGDESGVLHLDSPLITLPSGVTAPLLTFDHWISVEGGFDGGNLRVSVNGGAWMLVAPADFTYNAYNATLLTAAQGSTNPLAGQRAFSGSDGGSVLGSWGRSHVNLAPYAGPGDTVRLRFDLGTDFCFGLFGWYVDDVTVYACAPNTPPTINVGDIAVTEGHKGFTPAAFTVSLSHPFAKRVSVRYRLFDGSARRGRDYVPFDDDEDGRVVIPPLSISGEAPVRIRGDRQVEPNETFFLRLHRPVNGAIGDGEGMCTIVDDDGAP